MRLIAPALLSLFLIGPCAAAEDNTPPPPPAAAASEAARAAVPQERRIYYLQHRLIPNWVFKTSGAFYADLRSGSLDRLRAAASEIVSPEYAAGIKVTPYPDLNGVLIEYPTPQAVPHCYYTFIHAVPKGEPGYAVYTYEKTVNFPGAEPMVGVVGRWSADGAHGNLGPRKYQDVASFVADLKLDVNPDVKN